MPLPEILANIFQCGVKTKKVQNSYSELLKNIGSEFFILLHASLKEIEIKSTKQIANAINKVRQGDIVVEPGYDGEFGVVKVFGEKEKHREVEQSEFDL